MRYGAAIIVFGLLVLGLIVGAGDRAAWAEDFAASTVTIVSTTDGQPQELPASLLRPLGTGPFPAVVMLHDCSGRGPHASGAAGRWGRLLASEGYVVIIPDSFAPRGFPDGVCTLPLDAPTVLPLTRAGDALVALAFLRTLPEVDGKHVGVMGGSHGGTTTLIDDATPISPNAPFAAERQNGFAAAIALYPGCAGRFGGWDAKRAGPTGPITDYVGAYHPIAPLLILIGEQDDWTPAAHCAALAEHAQAAGYAVSIKIYPGARHSFDSDAPLRYLDARRNLNNPAGHGATTAGDPAAWADSIARVKTFFGSYLKN
jgi:dienelactone hydrolase